MKFIADLHIHSHYSLATSKNLIPEQLELWAGIKGINLVGTGDCTHPGWLKELKEKLEPAGNGFYKLKDSFRLKNVVRPAGCPGIFFVLTGEVSSIYKKNGRVRKVHNLCVFDCFESAENFQNRLSKVGNIISDGRPILGLDSKNLLEMLLETSETSYLIPAHIWTPWFSVLGSKSGFDTINECFDELTKYIFAVETGLSSDPPMNRRCSFLDSFNLVSNSDAHSPEKLGREANLFDTKLTYNGVFDALKTGSGFLGTIEFFPQEGKYHYDGHRKCNVCWNPSETIKNKGICPVCGKEVTKGVMYRVAELSDRNNPDDSTIKKVFHSIVPLGELLSEIAGVQNSSSKKVKTEYFKIIEKLGSEFNVLLFAGISDIKNTAGPLLAEGIRRLRDGKVRIQEGFDGEFGRIKVFEEDELANTGMSLFSFEKQEPAKPVFKIKEFKKEKKVAADDKSPERQDAASYLTDEQRQAIEYSGGPCMVIAGPGSGKTRVLTERIIHLINEKGVAPRQILGITFSNKASEEMKNRIEKKIAAGQVLISTFHSFGLSVIEKYFENFGRKKNFSIIDEEDGKEILGKLITNRNRISHSSRDIGNFKQGIIGSPADGGLFEAYECELKTINAFDLDDLIYLPVILFRDNPEILRGYRERYRRILVDEYQDINARQYELIKMLAGEKNPDLFVISDPDQAIYGFRGSDVKFIEQLGKDYPGLVTILLKDSFRCPDNVIRAGLDVLGKNIAFSGGLGKMKVNVQECETEKSEADWIASKIENMIGGTRSFSIDSGISDGVAACGTESFSDFAIFCRTAHMFEPIIYALANHGIAYQVISTETFFQREPVSSAVGLFRKIYYKMGIEPSQQNNSARIQKMICAKENITEILLASLEAGKILEDDARKLKTLTSGMANDYDGFFKSIALRRSIDDYNGNIEAVTLMTLHAAKGLEFNTVFIPGCEERIIPFELFGKKNCEELEEEKRLFYVGITRTKQNLFLTYAKKRMLKGRLLLQRKSALVDKIKDELVRFEIREPKKRTGQPELF